MFKSFGRAIVAAGIASFSGTAIATEVKVVLDTTYNEGSIFKITAATASNVSYFWWSVVDGYKFKILDPESKTLGETLPRVSKGEFIRFRFSAKIKDSVAAQDVVIRIRDDVPDPVFSFAPPASWNGATTVDVKPGITNLAQIRNCRFPKLRYAWYADSVPVDTAWRDSSMVLKSASANGTLALKLCLDNGGATVCKAAVVLVKRPPVAISNPATGTRPAGGHRVPGRFWRPDGRYIRIGSAPAAVFPRISITR